MQKKSWTIVSIQNLIEKAIFKKQIGLSCINPIVQSLLESDNIIMIKTFLKNDIMKISPMQKF